MTNLFLIAQTGGTNWLVLIGLFGAIATGMYLLAEFVFGTKTRTESRLDRLSRRNEQEENAPKKSITDLLNKYNPKISEALKPKSEKEINSQQQLLSEAGWRNEDAPKLFASLRFFSAVGGFVVGGGLGLLATGFSFWPVVYAAVVGALFSYLPQLFLALAARSRKQKLFLGLPDSLDLCLLYTSPSPRDRQKSRMPSSA